MSLGAAAFAAPFTYPENKKGGKIMLTCIYVVEKIDGDYAELRRVDALKHDPEETKKVARALLPGDIMEGNKLLYENLQYRIITD